MADYANPDVGNEQGRNWGGSAPAEPKGFDVLGSVDITDRPIPNADPAGEKNYSYEQPAYFKMPAYDNDGEPADLEGYDQNGHKY